MIEKRFLSHYGSLILISMSERRRVTMLAVAATRSSPFSSHGRCKRESCGAGAADDQVFALCTSQPSAMPLAPTPLIGLSRLPAAVMSPGLSRMTGSRRCMQTAVAAGERPAKSSPLHERDFFAVRNCFTLKEMFDARVHLGHKEGTLNPLMKPYVLGSRLKHLIIDLDQTTRLLGDALNFTAHIASRRGIILIINRSRQVCLPHCPRPHSLLFADWSSG